MADWQFKLDVKDAWTKAENDEISTVELAKVFVEKIKELKNEILGRAENPVGISESMVAHKFVRLAEILEKEVLIMFEEIADCENDDVEEFDNAMSYLYDWADTKLDDYWNGKKMCWISTTI